MKSSASVRLELKNSRYQDRELKEHLSELILYSKYAGISLEGLHESIANAKLAAGQDGLDMRFGGKLILETSSKMATLINQLVQMYPVFSTWDIKVSEVRKSSATKNRKKEKVMATKKPAKKAAKKAAKPAKKAAAKPAKKAAKKKAAKKK